MAVRPIAVLALLTFALVAGCSDGPPSGDLVAKPGAVAIEGTSINTYVAESGGQANPVPNQPKICPTDPTGNVPPCVPASSNYKVHFMSLPEPSGDGYAIFQVGGDIGERQLGILAPTTGSMYEGNFTASQAEDQSQMFDRLELRMGSYVVAAATSAAGSQAFVADASLAGVTVTGSYKADTLTLDVSGLPGDGTHPQFVGRLYTEGASGNLTVGESFNLFNGQTEYKSKDHNIGDFVEFHIHVGTSKIYVYQATL